MRNHRLVLVASLVLAGFFLAPNAQARNKFWKQTTLNAGGGAKEVSVNKKVHYIKIYCKDGSVTINTIVVREGGKKTPIKATTPLQKGQHQVWEISGGPKQITGLRISDGGKGTYDVLLKR